LDLGYTGIIVTDHFYNGHCSLNRNLPWEKWVHEFCRGFEEAREEGARRGLDVFFGWEETFDGADDYLIYGLDKEWLLEHPEARFWTRKEQFEVVNHYGSCVVQAHPFRQSFYINCIRLHDYVDAIEIGNGANQRPHDALARAYTNKYKIPAVAGSDLHQVQDLYNDNAFGVYLDKKMETIADYVKAVKNNTIKGLKAPVGRFDLLGDEKILLPLVIRDKQAQNIGNDFLKFLKT
jgi:hypothetical protein